MCLVKKITVGIAILAATFCVAPVPVSASTFDNVFVFGDSSVDTGWFRYKALPSNPTLNHISRSFAR